MKKITKLLTVALTLALLFGVVLGVSAVADGNEPAAQADEKWIVSTNVVYAESIYPMFAVDASHAADPALLEVTVEREGAVSDCYNKGKNVEITTGAGKKTVHVYKGAGVPAKDMTDTLTITVKYDGDAVETKTYSVAEYFFERLYKNEIVFAANASTLLQKELYVATLEYCTAAQGVLEPSAVVDLSQYVYVWGDVEPAMMLKSEATVTFADNSPYVFEYYTADGKSVAAESGAAYDIAYAAGTYAISGFTKISKAAKMPTAPEGAVTFDGKSGEITGFTSNSIDLGIGAGAIKTVGQTTQNAEILEASYKSDALGNVYLTHIKDASSIKRQTWTTYMVDTDKTAGLETIVFESSMKLDINGGAIQLRAYTGNRTIAAEKDGEKGTSHAILSFQKNSSSDNLWIDSKDAGLFLDKWFIVRVEITNYTEGDNVVISIFDEKTGEFVSKVTKSVAAITDVSALTAFVFMTYSDTYGSYCSDYAYVGATPTSYGAEGTANPVIGYAGNFEATISPIIAQ